MVVMNKIPQLLSEGADVKTWAANNREWLEIVIDKHNDVIVELDVDKYQQAYDGFLKSVDERDKARGDGINHKLQVNYAQIIIDTPVDYMTGKPISWTVYDQTEQAKADILEAYRSDLLGILKTEDTKLALSELLRQGSISGYSGLISWVDEDGVIAFDEFPVQELIPVYTTRGKLKLVLRRYVVEEGEELVTRLEYYDDRYVAYFLGDSQGKVFELDIDEVATGNPVEHKAARIPVSVYTNGTPSSYVKRQKKAGVSDLDNGVMTLIENYSDVMSDKANTADKLLDQFLLFKNVTIDENEVLKMRKARAIALKGAASDASFIAPSQDDTTIENHLDRTQQAIHDTAFIPKLSDIAGTTAMEVRMRYSNLDIKAGRKELYFMKAVRYFVQTITDMLNTRRLLEAGVENPYEILKEFNKPVKEEGEELTTAIELYNADWVDITINRNLPQNYSEITTIVAQLIDFVPDAYLYELLWFIEDPTAAIEEMRTQKEAGAEAAAKAGLAAMGLGGEFGNTGTPTVPNNEQGGAIVK